MHRSLRRPLQPLAGDAEDAVVLAQRRDVAGLHALELQPQDVQRVGPLDGVFDAIEDGDAQSPIAARQQRSAGRTPPPRRRAW